jgi:tetratricopeptide (TPR) repeat protein
MRGLAPVILSLLLPAAWAGDPKPAPDKLLDQAFRSCLSDEELVKFGKKAKPEALAAAMEPEQKLCARERLVESEKDASPDGLREIARGYSLLGFLSEDGLRAGQKLQELDPKSSDGFTLAARSSFEQGDDAAAMRSAAAALKLNPQDNAAFAIYKFAQRRSPSAAPAGEPVALKPVEAPKDTGAAIPILQQAVIARKAGDIDKAYKLAIDAMRVSPSVPEVQQFYRIASADFAKQVKAVQPPDLQTPDEKPPSKEGGFPLWPIGAAAGLGLLGYGVSRSRPTKEDTQEEPADPDRWKRHAAAIGTSLLIGFSLVFGKRAGKAVIPSLASVWKAVRGNSGSISPPVVASSSRIIPGFSEVESNVINEAQQILGSPEFAKLEEAFKAGRPAIVKIGGRVIQYEPDMPTSGMSNFEGGGFYIGREAFKSAAELQKTVLHELYRLATTQSSQGVTGKLAADEAKEAFTFADRAAGAIKR